MGIMVRIYLAENRMIDDWREFFFGARALSGQA
jgi:hypothetical protein